MKAILKVTDDGGNVYQGEVVLVPVAGARHSKTVISQKSLSEAPISPTLDFTLSSRPFIKKNVTLQTSGPQKFVILLAWLVKGKIGVQIKAEIFQKEWNKVRGPIGLDYQSMYATRAKDHGWIDSPKLGVFVLARDWKGAFSR